jgi:hypothetical protein
MQTTRFTTTVTEAGHAELALRERREVERTYRRLLAVSDGVLNGLEQRNFTGRHELDQVIRRDVSRMVRDLPPEIRSRYPLAATSVQEALDGTLEVQEELMLVLQRLHRDVVLAGSMDGAA